ncbi:MAG: TonB-dependent receptor [Caulobacteraceae bacterium]|nr:TonB-dependent receptor [Caulobacteraceae bacterium]
MLAIGASSVALISAAPTLAQTAPAGQAPAARPSSTTVGEIIVTAERREESLQSTPVAVSAFSEAKLKVQRLDGGQNIEIAVPNVNYSRSNFGSYNLSIRGVGTKTVGAGGTAGVSINEDELPVAANHFQDTDFYDTQRVEVLRGPQGTLYGRNATGGAVNIITNKPTDTFGGSITGEYGNYNERKAYGYINLPLGDMFAVRIAGYGLRTDGFGYNTYTHDHVDSRNLGSGRITLSFKPNDRFDAYLLYEHFGENDSRNRVGKQLCTTDNGPATVGNYTTNALDREWLSQGCKEATLYSNAAYSQINSNGATPLNNLIGLTGAYTTGNVFANNSAQDHNLHDIQSIIDPSYTARSDLAMLHMNWNITDNLTLQSLTGYYFNTGTSAEDYNRVVPNTSYSSTPDPSALWYNFYQAAGLGSLYKSVFQATFPGGYVNDPQTGNTNKLNSLDYGNTTTREITQELRLSSSFKGPLNFSAGLYYSDNETPTGAVNYYVESSGLTSYAQLNNNLYNSLRALSQSLYGNPNTLPNALSGAGITYGTVGTIPTGDGYPPTGKAGNYYDARFGPGSLKTYAGFGELYWDITPTVKLTAGARYNVDELYNPQYPILLETVGSTTEVGCPSTPNCITVQTHTWREMTGRANLDWTPSLSFTDKTLIYGSYSRGYKGGGFNTPCSGGVGQAVGVTCPYPETFQPEFIDAFEIGTKNTLAGGTIMLNADAFYYNYTGYQISKIVDQSSVNENINARIYGAEFEGLWSPVHDLTLNANLGYLHTEITSGSSIDTLNLTASNPNYTVIKEAGGSDCIVTTKGLQDALNAGLGGSLLGLQCPTTNLDPTKGTTAAQEYAATIHALAGVPTSAALALANELYTYGPNASVSGVEQSLKGRQLPNSPEWTISLGAQYVWELADDWKITGRVDYYWQASSYARIYNTVEDKLKAWDNVNMTLTFDKASWGLNAQLWVKNLTDNQPITDIYITNDGSGLFANTFTLDPRTFGVTLTKKF